MWFTFHHVSCTIGLRMGSRPKSFGSVIEFTWYFCCLIGSDIFEDPLSWEITGRNILSMFVMGFVYFGLTLLIEYKFFIRRRQVILSFTFLFTQRHVTTWNVCGYSCLQPIWWLVARVCFTVKNPRVLNRYLKGHSYRYLCAIPHS